MSLNYTEECYAAAFIYALKLIDEKAAQRGELVLPEDCTHNVKCKPEIKHKAMCNFVSALADKIATAEDDQSHSDLGASLMS
jgi:hypothetical protein